MSSNELTTPQQAAWLGLAAHKNNTVAELERRELALQSILLQPLEDKAATLKSYRAEFTALKNFRQEFTNMISGKLIDPLLEFEKRADPKTNAAYKLLETEELNERISAERERQKTEGLSIERVNFKTHILNEYERVAMEFRQTLYAEILNASREGHTIEAFTATLKEMKPGAFRKFPTQHLEDAEKAEILRSVPAPDWDLIRLEMIAEANKGLENLESKVAQDSAEAAGNARINERMATQTIAQVVTPKIRRNVEVVTEASVDWARAVLVGFMNNELWTRVRVKAIENLTIGQMAKAIGEYTTETGEEISGLSYREIVK